MKKTKKLVVSRETVRILQEAKLEGVAGGTVGPTCGCTNSNYIDCPMEVGP